MHYHDDLFQVYLSLNDATVVDIHRLNKHLSSNQCDDKDFRGPSWRRQFPPRDVHGISMMPGSAETLPAGFRLTATSGHSRRLPPEGKRPPLQLNAQVADLIFQAPPVALGHEERLARAQEWLLPAVL